MINNIHRIMLQWISFWLLLFIYLLPCTKSQCADNSPCFPRATDVTKLSSFKLSVNSTCGDPVEAFCVSTDCTLECNATNSQNAHPASHMIDNYELLTYWKSKNFDEPVYIRIDFGTKLLLHQISITFPFEELPNGFYIQRSQDDGRIFSVLVYYAIKCMDTFKLPSTPVNKYDGTKVLCFEMDPSSVSKTVNYSPTRDSTVMAEYRNGGRVRNHFLTTNVKIVLHEFFKPSNFDVAVADRKKFYFAVRDLDVQAGCYCNGMSFECDPKDYGKCICYKNTEGRNCESCAGIYNNKPWTFGKACESCNCNNHTSACVYDASKRHGVCKDCNDNTKGDRCDRCDDGYYRNISVLITHKKACVACGCVMIGVKFGSVVCDALTGKCLCKSNVGGARCDTCNDGYYGLSGSIMNGCDTCACSVFGTAGASRICDKITGQCPCKDGFTERTCTACKVGFYGYPPTLPSECKECNCNPSGSHNMTCELSGQCFCRNEYYDRQCGKMRIGFFSPNVNQLRFSSLLSTVSSPVAYKYKWVNITESSGNTFFVLGYLVGLGGSSSTDVTMLTFSNINIPADAYYEVFLQYMTGFSFSTVNIRFELLSSFSQYSCNNGSITVVANIPSTLVSNIASTKTSQSFGSTCLTQGQYKIAIWFSPNSAGQQSDRANIFVMSLLFLPRYEYSSYYLSSSLTTKQNVELYYAFASDLQSWSLKESQGAKYLAYLYGSLFNAAIGCGCDQVGSTNPAVCNEYGGQCNCKQNVYGRTCSACLPEHFNFTSGPGCARCECDMIGSLNNTCDQRTGQCPCKPNVVGRTCNTCALNYFGIKSNTGCQACNCKILYSTSSSCDENGNCKCKPGVGGAKCSECRNGYYDLTISGCRSCICNQIGTDGNKCNPTTGTCSCKPLVMGSRCDKCMVGYYGFSADFPDTCLKCHCNDKTQDCDVAKEYYLTFVNSTFSTKENNVGLQDWTSVNLNGQSAGSMTWVWAPQYSLERGYVQLKDPADLPELFYSAPEKFLGDKRSSYMYYLTFDLTQKSDTNPEVSRQDGDVIIKGKKETYKLVTQLTTLPKEFQKPSSYKIQFNEKVWKKNSLSGAQSSNAEMINTLSDLEYIYIRGKWTKSSGEFTGISNVYMEYSTYDLPNTVGFKVAKNVEYCNCPNEYTDQYCQECNVGFTRLPANGGVDTLCEACRCYEHSGVCDKSNGTCINCLHNTRGVKCELCSDGYYGDAMNGQPDDCKPCMCPGGIFARNQFATKCALDTDKRPTCMDCQDGYTGRSCEVCSDGYYGNPMHPLGNCQKCTCNGNVEQTAAGNCNTTTGECLRCLFNTVGMSCEWCLAGYYGDALTKSCHACKCNGVGSLGSDCHNITGHCNCKPNVVGRTCDMCALDTFNFQSNKGCEPCNCHLKGSLESQCDVSSGKCTCNTTVVGDKCDKCAPGYYNLDEGCLACACNQTFTIENTTCDAITGQCLCRESPLGGPYSGRTCNECSVNAIGTPPDCELCHSPCYDNWQKYIEGEGRDIATMQSNITNLLSKFGGMTYEHIESQLSWLNGNLTTAMNVFSGARYNTSVKEQQFRKIETHVIEFEIVLRQVDNQLKASNEFFHNTVSSFNGTVALDARIPQPQNIPLINIRVKRTTHLLPRTVDAQYVIEMADGFIQTSGKNNMSGQAIYTTITDQYKKIVESNASIADAAEKLSGAMADLAKAASKRAEIDGFLDTQYKAAYATNSYELKKIHDIVASIMIMQNKTVTIHTAALETLKSAQIVIAQATKDAQNRQAEAVGVSQSVSQMKIDALTLKGSVIEQQKTATDLKAKVDDVLLDVEKELQILAKGVRDIAETRNKTEEILKLAYTIGNTSMPITLTDIEELSKKIQSTVINEGVINATFEDAQAGLTKAQEVQHRSKTALDVSQTTLKDIENLELSLLQSNALRKETTRMQAETDVMVNEILNVTSQIERDFNTVSGQGRQTLLLLNNAIDQAETNKMCFVNAKALVDNATQLSKEARNTAQVAYVLHQSNEKLIPQYADQINSLHASTSAGHIQAGLASNNAEKLLSDVTEAERLLSEYETRDTELTKLETETETLEAELNELLIKFEQERVRLSGCGKP